MEHENTYPSNSLFLQTEHILEADFVLLEDDISLSSAYYAVGYIKYIFTPPPDIVTWVNIELQVVKNLYNKGKNTCWRSKSKMSFNVAEVTINIMVTGTVN